MRTDLSSSTQPKVLLTAPAGPPLRMLHPSAPDRTPTLRGQERASPQTPPPAPIRSQQCRRAPMLCLLTSIWECLNGLHKCDSERASHTQYRNGSQSSPCGNTGAGTVTMRVPGGAARGQAGREPTHGPYPALPHHRPVPYSSGWRVLSCLLHLLPPSPVLKGTGMRPAMLRALSCH